MLMESVVRDEGGSSCEGIGSACVGDGLRYDVL